MTNACVRHPVSCCLTTEFQFNHRDKKRFESVLTVTHKKIYQEEYQLPTSSCRSNETPCADDDDYYCIKIKIQKFE